MLDADYSFLQSYPYLLSGQFCLENIQSLLVQGYIRSISKNDSDFIRIWNDGILHVAKSEWDSRHFGIPMARIEHISFIDHERMLVIYDELKGWLFLNGIEHLSVRLNIENTPAINFLFRDQFDLMNGKVMLRYEGLTMQTGPLLVDNVHIKKMNLDFNAEVLVNIIEASFNENRFIKDNSLDRSKSEQVYAQWVQNFSSRFPEKVYIASLGGQIAGFCFFDINVIDRDHKFGLVNLIAVSKNHLRKGIAKSLLSCVLYEFRQIGVSVVHANIVNSNLSSLLLFQSMGFKVYSQLVEARKLVEEH